jgi:hypothetical protein
MTPKILFDILFAELQCTPILVLLYVCFGQLAVYSIPVLLNIKKKENYEVNLYREIIFFWWSLQGTFIGLHIV